MGNYSLQKYKGTATRHTCPKCGDRHSFVYYVDENNVPLHPSVGRCNHESGCGYHYTPKEYFQEHPEHRTTNDFSFDRQRAEQKKVKQQSKPTAIGYIPPHYVEKSQSERSNFFRFLFTLLTSYYGDKAKEVLKRLLEEYRLGATRDGSVIFWQIDRTGKVRTGKVMQYNPEDGHRIKGGQTSAVNWIHSILKKQRVLAEDWQLSQCLFGEHLLKTHPDKVVVLVESEKSAVIGSAIFPDYVWLATGGKSQMREEKLRVLSGRTVLLFPDADAYAEWKPAMSGGKAVRFEKTLPITFKYTPQETVLTFEEYLKNLEEERVMLEKGEKMSMEDMARRVNAFKEQLGDDATLRKMLLEKSQSIKGQIDSTVKVQTKVLKLKKNDVKELTKIYEDEIDAKIKLIESLGTDQFISYFVESELEMRKIEMDKMLKIKDLLKDRFKLYFENYILQQ